MVEPHADGEFMSAPFCGTDTDLLTWRLSLFVTDGYDLPDVSRHTVLVSKTVADMELVSMRNGKSTA